jgi:sugar phosphate isomerase/epimerase
MAFCNIGCNLVNDAGDSMETFYSKESYLPLLEKYRSWGIHHLEFSHVMMLSVGDARELRQRCRELGLVPWSIHSEHLNGRDGLEEYMRVQAHCAAIAEALDARIMVCHLPNLQPRHDFETAQAIICRLADITRAQNLHLAVENCAFAGEIDFICHLVAAIDRPDVGVNFDSGHAFLVEGQTLPAALRKIGSWLFTTHLQDNFGENDDHQAPGMGFIDWAPLLATLQEIGYQGPLMLELTGWGVKANRTVPQLRQYPLERELLLAQAYLQALWCKNQNCGQTTGL